ncbi:MAG TPA: cytochrome D1 domain-containing protein, partial [Chromatiaceae bacterium]|nr:cytochrome D1 domain-containing protein [Chromatiaceae bacterium]
MTARLSLTLIPLAMALFAPVLLAETNPAGSAMPPAPAAMVPVTPTPAPITGEPREAGALYAQICAECHGADRLGITGPPLIPENFGRLKREDAAKLILEGRPATQMPPFADRLSQAEAQALVDLVFTPLPATPKWGLERIRQSHLPLVPLEKLPDRPLHNADPLNLFVVVETGDHHATILDGDRLEPLHRFATRRALHGGPKFSNDGRFVYFASRDGWISKFDLHSFQTVAEIRAGINTRNLAVSGDGRYVAYHRFSFGRRV